MEKEQREGVFKTFKPLIRWSWFTFVHYREDLGHNPLFFKFPFVSNRTGQWCTWPLVLQGNISQCLTSIVLVSPTLPGHPKPLPARLGLASKPRCWQCSPHLYTQDPLVWFSWCKLGTLRPSISGHFRSFSSSGAFSFSSEKITVVAFCFLVFPVQGQDQTDGGDLYWPHERDKKARLRRDGPVSTWAAKKDWAGNIIFHVTSSQVDWPLLEKENSIFFF